MDESPFANRQHSRVSLMRLASIIRVCTIADGFHAGWVERKSARRINPPEVLGTLDSEQVKDEHLKVLAQALALKSLDASDTLISDAGLVHLSSLKNLRWLDVGTSDRHDKCMFLFGWLMTKSHCKATENELQSLKRFCEEHPGPVAN